MLDSNVKKKEYKIITLHSKKTLVQMDTTQLITLRKHNYTKPSSLLSMKNKHTQICYYLRNLL